MDIDTLIAAIEQGKSRGYSATILKNNTTYIQEFAIKRNGEQYLAYTFSIDESKMDVFEDYGLEEFDLFSRIEDAFAFIEKKGGILKNFNVFKGSKIL